MDKEIFEGIQQGLKESLAHAKGARKGYRTHRVKVPKEVDVKAIRTKLKMTQVSFAETFGFSVDAVRNWEGHRRTPEKAARILLRVIERNPRAVFEATA